MIKFAIALAGFGILTPLSLVNYFPFVNAAVAAVIIVVFVIGALGIGILSQFQPARVSRRALRVIATGALFCSILVAAPILLMLKLDGLWALVFLLAMAHEINVNGSGGAGN